MALGNLGFEEGVPEQPGRADLWTATVTVSGERMALYGSDPTTVTEGFETEWDEDYLFAFGELDVTPPIYDVAVSDGEGLEDFEEGWDSNHTDGDELSALEVAEYATTGDPAEFEGFETEWSTNEDDVTAFAGPMLSAGTFTGSGNVDGFETGWNTNENDVTTMGSTSAASYDSGGPSPEDREDFEETYFDRLVGTVIPGTDVVVVPSLHGFGVGDRVQFRLDGSGALPGGLNASFLYYVRAGGLTTTDFTVAVASGGAAVDITDEGVGAIYIRGNPARYWRDEL